MNRKRYNHQGTYMEWGRYAGSSYSSSLSAGSAPRFFVTEKDRELWLLMTLNYNAGLVQRVWRGYLDRRAVKRKGKFFECDFKNVIRW